MPRKSSTTKAAIQPQISQINLATIPEDLDKLSSTLTNTALHSSVDLVQRLINKELISCANRLEIEVEELQAWLEIHQLAPQKIQLHLLRTANQYLLDPLQEEVMFAQYEQSWHLAISVDGWIKIINSHPHFSGITFVESSETDQGLPLWMECSISRTDRIVPTTVREYLSEVRQEGDLWKKMPRRMLRHRTLQQCARIAMAIPVAGNKEEYQMNAENNATPNTVKGQGAILSGSGNIKQIEKLKGLLQNS